MNIDQFERRILGPGMFILFVVLVTLASQGVL